MGVLAGLDVGSPGERVAGDSRALAACVQMMSPRANKILVIRPTITNYSPTTCDYTPRYIRTITMSESLAAFRSNRSNDLRQLAEEHLQHE